MENTEIEHFSSFILLNFFQIFLNLPGKFTRSLVVNVPPVILLPYGIFSPPPPLTCFHTQHTELEVGRRSL